MRMTKDRVHEIGREALLLYENDARMLLDEFMILGDWHDKYYKGGNTLEIGAYKGMTSFVMAAFMNEYSKRRRESKHYIVDMFDVAEDNWGYKEYREEDLILNVGRFIDLVEIKKGKSLDYEPANMVISNKFDMVFIDGDHRDPILYLELCLLDGVTEHITGHDYGHPGVTASVDRFCLDRGYRVSQPNANFGMFEIIK